MNGANQGPMSVTIPVPMVPPSANVLRRRYRHPMAYKRLRDSWKRMLWALVQGHDKDWLLAMAALGKRMRVDINIMHSRLYDRDNAYGSVKPCLDSLVSLHFLAGDSEKHIDLHVEQTKSRANETIITIREAL